MPNPPRTSLAVALLGTALAVAACGGDPSSMPASSADGRANMQMASASAAPMTPAAGGTMVDGRGMSIYWYDRDQPTRSNCTGRCARDWRPVTAPQGAVWSHDWSTITRADGTQQWVYQGHPLYTSARDAQAGDETGEGADRGRWHLVRR